MGKYHVNYFTGLHIMRWFDEQHHLYANYITNQVPNLIIRPTPIRVKAGDIRTLGFSIDGLRCMISLLPSRTNRVQTLGFSINGPTI